MNVKFFIISHIPQSPKGTPRPPPKHRRPFDVFASQKPPPFTPKTQGCADVSLSTKVDSANTATGTSIDECGAIEGGVLVSSFEGCSPLWIRAFAMGARTGSSV